MAMVKIPPRQLGRTDAFLSYDTLEGVNSIDSDRRFKYATRAHYTPSATFNNRALMFGIGEESARAISEELKSRGYIGLVEIKVINPRMGVNQISGRPVVRA